MGRRRLDPQVRTAMPLPWAVMNTALPLLLSEGRWVVGPYRNGVTSERASVVSVPMLFFTSLTTLDPEAQRSEIGQSRQNH